jgi:predicted MFS family arabinose efflux permease
MVADLGLSKSTAGLIASANFAGYLAGAVAGSVAGPKGSERAWMLSALAASALTTAAMAVATSVALMLALRFAGGAASALVMVLAASVVLDRLAAQGRPGLSDVHFAGVGAGIAVSAAVVAGLAAAGGHWRDFWWASGALSCAGVAAAALLLPPTPPTAAAAVAKSATQPGARPALARYAAAYGLFGAGYVITATFLVAIVRDDPTMRPLEPIVWVIVGLTAVPSVAVWGRIGRRIGIARAYATACLIEAAGILACIWPGGPVGALGAAVVLGATIMGITALGLMGARALAAADPRRTFAWMTAAFGTGQILGPIAAGYAVDATGSFAPPIIGAALVLVAAAVVVPRESNAGVRSGSPRSAAQGRDPR